MIIEACPLAFQVEVLDDQTMKLILDGVPQPGMEMHITAPMETLLLLSRVIQVKAAVGYTLGSS